MPRTPPNWPKLPFLFSGHRHFTGNDIDHVDPVVVLFLFDLIILHFNIPLSLVVSHRHLRIKCEINISSIKKKKINACPDVAPLPDYSTVTDYVVKLELSVRTAEQSRPDAFHRVHLWKVKGGSFASKSPRRRWLQRQVPPNRKLSPRRWLQRRVLPNRKLSLPASRS